ncbi:hypothetical protein EZV62_025568 [Acer yangbiense]|uniref:DUF674 domain-containing protein n=1 Tax=Acer yangbiense TaxID=1000413 RepID=A0A5C7GY62_9ROSI|nr:hypothetical protein EZV62_025568 [Acer yangbiense]
MAAPNMKLKLFIDTKGQKVLFTEAGKDFVDFLFYLLSLPVATVIRLLKQKSLVGCLPDLYESIENLSQTYMQSNRDKYTLLYPCNPIRTSDVPLLLSDLKTRKVYRCNCTYYLAYVANSICPSCRANMNVEVLDLEAQVTSKVSNSSGFIKDLVTYIVTDNLEFKPMSAANVVSLFSKSSVKVKEVSELEVKVVEFGADECLKILKSSMECKVVFTSVFL